MSNEEVYLHITLVDGEGDLARVRVEMKHTPTALDLLDALYTTLNLKGFRVLDWEIIK